MDVFKLIICLIIAVVIYLIGGLIVWNIVCTWIDIESCTLIEISNYRVYTYSGLVVASCCIAEIKKGSDIDGASGVPLLTGFIACIVNQWESVWDSVAIILTILYNIINIAIMTYSFYQSSKW